MPFDPKLGNTISGQTDSYPLPFVGCLGKSDWCFRRNDPLLTPMGLDYDAAGGSTDQPIV